MKEIEVYTRGDEVNNNNFPSTIMGIYGKDSVNDHDATLRKYSYSQADFNDHPFDLTARKRDSWSLNETIQKLYDLDSNISRKMFLDEYFNFMKKRGAVVTKIPVVAKLPLDLYRLYNAVQSFGGYAQVVKKRKWSRVVRDLGLPPSITSAAYTLRTQYLRLLYHFECEKNGVAANNLFFYEEQESIKQWSPGPMQRYETSSLSPKRFKIDDLEHDKIDMPRDDDDKNNNKEDRKEECDSQITFVELSRDKREKSFEKHYNGGELDDDVLIIPPRTQSPSSIKRSRSEELFRRRSLDDEEIVNVRPASYDNIMRNHNDTNEEQHSRKRKHEEDESQSEHENIIPDGDKPIENGEPLDDRNSVKSISPRPTNGEISPNNNANNKRRFEHHHYYNQRPRSLSREEDSRKDLDSDIHRIPRYTNNEELPNRRQFSRHEYVDHHTTSNGNYSPHPKISPHSKASCQCSDCYPTNQRFQTNGGEPKVINGSYHHSLHSPSQIVPKNCLSPHFQMNGYERHHLKKQYHDIEDQRLKRYNVYRGPNRNQKLSTNPSEMTLKIKERTENAIVLSIVVGGIYYSGTLLTSLKR